jgi:hypothetical protein
MTMGRAFPWLFFAVFFAVHAEQAIQRPFWLDELFTLALVSDGSWVHMLRALAGGVDGAFPAYPTMAWLWAQCLGVEEWSLRFLSLLCTGLAMIMWWRLCRRRFGDLAAACAVVFLFGLCRLHLVYWIDARSYALLQCGLVLALLTVERGGWRLHLSLALLTLTHLFGLVYGGLVALMRWRLAGWRSGAAAVFSLGTVVVWLPGILGQKRISHPHSGLQVPSVETLLFMGGNWMVPAFVVVLVPLLLSIFFSRENAPVQRQEKADDVAWRAAFCWFVAGSILVVPVVWAFSQTSVPIFAPRYFLPTGFAVAGWVAWWVQRREWSTSQVTARWASAVVWMVGLVGLLSIRTGPVEDMTDAVSRIEWLDERVKDRPLVVESPRVYLPWVHRHPGMDRRLHFVLDWEMVVDSSTSRNAAIYHNLLHARRHFYPKIPGSAGIVESEAFLRAHPKFIVVRDTGLRLWFDYRILNNPDYVAERWKVIVSERRKVMPRLEVWLVERSHLQAGTAPHPE